MTAFAFILGVLPLVVATGSGAASRQILGTTVLGGMLAATAIAVFIVPATFYVSQRFIGERHPSLPGREPAGPTPPGAGPAPEGVSR
jgi:HAE1 family hydrophobic/amphiphilic exporter-1